MSVRVRHYHTLLKEGSEPPAPGSEEWADEVLHRRSIPSREEKLTKQERQRREAWAEYLTENPEFGRCEISGVEAWNNELETVYAEDDQADQLTVLRKVLEDEGLGVESDVIPREQFEAIKELAQRPPYADGVFRREYYASSGDPYDPPEYYDGT